MKPKYKNDSEKTILNPARRSAIKAVGAGVAATAFPFIWTPSRAASKRIVVRDDGGIYTKAYGAVYYKPFFEQTGIEVVGVQANAEPTAQIKSMVESGTYSWDMAKISQPAILLLTSGGKEYLEKHNLEPSQGFRSSTCRHTAWAPTSIRRCSPIAPMRSRAAKRPVRGRTCGT
jgi:putative spermidine/putrescine transport system substrate-binding protein